MTKFTLSIGDKNLSSWSLRPWVLMTHAGIAFEEENIKLDQPETRGVLKEKSPSGFVPFLTHHRAEGDLKIWDSLAIMEYMHDLFPEKNLWPADLEARTVARSIAAEMHSGFSNLRAVWPMMFTREGLRHLDSGGVGKDIARIDALWTMCRKQYGADGDFLFGDFTIADAMYAPVVSRFVTYGPVKVSAASVAYMETMRALPAMQKWGEGARAEIA